MNVTPTYSTQFQKLKKCQAAVKLHGVFLSWCKLAASSRPLQFRRAFPQDSRQIVQPFVRVGTSYYSTITSGTDYTLALIRRKFCTFVYQKGSFSKLRFESQLTLLKTGASLDTPSCKFLQNIQNPFVSRIVVDNFRSEVLLY